MKTPTLITRVQEFLDADKKKQRDQIKCLKELLHKLKKKQHTLKAKLETERDDKTRKRLRKDLDVIFAQRKKGIATLKTLKKS